MEPDDDDDEEEEGWSVCGAGELGREPRAARAAAAVRLCVGGCVWLFVFITYLRRGDHHPQATTQNPEPETQAWLHTLSLADMVASPFFPAAPAPDGVPGPPTAAAGAPPSSPAPTPTSTGGGRGRGGLEPEEEDEESAASCWSASAPPRAARMPRALARAACVIVCCLWR